MDVRRDMYNISGINIICDPLILTISGGTKKYHQYNVISKYDFVKIAILLLHHLILYCNLIFLDRLYVFSHHIFPLQQNPYIPFHVV